MSSIFIPLTFIAGVYGMNFDFDGGRMALNMPELHQPHGYVVCILLMLAIAIGQVIFFKRKRCFEVPRRCPAWDRRGPTR